MFQLLALIAGFAGLILSGLLATVLVIEMRVMRRQERLLEEQDREIRRIRTFALSAESADYIADQFTAYLQERGA